MRGDADVRVPVPHVRLSPAVQLHGVARRGHGDLRASLTWSGSAIERGNCSERGLRCGSASAPQPKRS